jgi:uncharacterized protein YecT (DUF1311 family)
MVAIEDGLVEELEIINGNSGIQSQFAWVAMRDSHCATMVDCDEMSIGRSSIDVPLWRAIE